MVDTLYILSAGRSGSTLLNLLLGSHPEAVGVSELSQIPRDLARADPCSCGSTVPDCAYWNEFFERMSRRLHIDLRRDPFALNLGFIADPRREHGPPLTAGYRAAWKLRHWLIYASRMSGVSIPAFMRREFDRGVDNTLLAYDVVREITGARVVVDASKMYLKGIALYQRRPENTRLLLLSRNGQASFYSRLRDGYGRNASLRAWRNYYRHALPLLRRDVPEEHVLRVKYEDVASDPAREMRRICEFAGLPFAPEMAELRADRQHIAAGNDMRLKSNARIRIDTAWQTGLKPADRRFFEACAGGLNRRLGYD